MPKKDVLPIALPATVLADTDPQVPGHRRLVSQVDLQQPLEVNAPCQRPFGPIVIVLANMQCVTLGEVLKCSVNRPQRGLNSLPVFGVAVKTVGHSSCWLTRNSLPTSRARTSSTPHACTAWRGEGGGWGLRKYTPTRSMALAPGRGCQNGAMGTSTPSDKARERGLIEPPRFSLGGVVRNDSKVRGAAPPVKGRLATGKGHFCDTQRSMGLRTPIAPRLRT